MKQEFSSIYAPMIQRYITWRENLGHTVRVLHYTLMMFDRLCISRHETDIGIGSSLLEAWCVKRPNELETTWYSRVAYIKAFAEFLTNCDFPSSSPVLPKHKKSDFSPYIFTVEQMADIFSAADSMVIDRSPRSTLSAVPCILRLLYASAIRVGEACSLRICDVDLDNNIITVSDSKNGKDRLIPISTSMAQELAVFRGTITFRQEQGEPFFVRRNAQRCIPQQVYRWFRSILFTAGIPHTGKGPRVHDIRHTATVHALASMARQETDLYVALPILSRYLGHQSLTATDNYVRLTAAMYPELIADVAQVSAFVFPEVSCNGKAD